MKHVLIAIGLGCFVLGAGCKRKPAENVPSSKPQATKKTLFRHHFVGVARFAASTDGSQFQKIWALPETAEFREALAERLTKTAQDYFVSRVSALGTNAAMQFRPLVADLLQAESFGELRETDQHVRELDLAIQLDDDRAQVWSTNCWQVAALWNGAPPVSLSGNGFAGWENAKPGGGTAFRFFRAGQWVLLSVGQAQAPTNLLNRIVTQGRPVASAKAYWLDADLDTAQLSAWFPDAPFVPWLADLQIKNFPVAHISISPKSEFLITLARLEYPQPVAWRSEPWQFPTNLVQNPNGGLIYFSAARGLTSLLADSKLLQQFGWSPPPSQAFFWGYGGMILQSYAAFPTPDATNRFARIAPRIQEFVNTNLPPNPTREVRWEDSGTTLKWTRLPIIAPALMALQTVEGEFLYAGLFPAGDTTNEPPPAALLDNLTRTNLAYYHWELTEWRLQQVRAITSLSDLIRKDCTIPQSTPSQRWLTAITPNLGNTVTEITRVSPKEIELVRSSHVGLSGDELIGLMRWIEGTNCVEGGGAPLPSNEERRTRAPANP